MLIKATIIAGVVFLIGAVISFLVALLIKGLFLGIRLIEQLGKKRGSPFTTSTK